MLTENTLAVKYNNCHIYLPPIKIYPSCSWQLKRSYPISHGNIFFKVHHMGVQYTTGSTYVIYKVIISQTLDEIGIHTKFVVYLLLLRRVTMVHVGKSVDFRCEMKAWIRQWLQVTFFAASLGRSQTHNLAITTKSETQTRVEQLTKSDRDHLIFNNFFSKIRILCNSQQFLWVCCLQSEAQYAYTGGCYLLADFWLFSHSLLCLLNHSNVQVYMQQGIIIWYLYLFFMCGAGGW